MRVWHVEKAFEDSRGTIADILENEPVSHAAIITNVKGSVRGNHVHAETCQWIYIVSGALRYVTQTGAGPVESAIVRAGDMLMTGPEELHATEALEDTTMFVLTRGPRGGKDYESDTVRLDVPLIAPRGAAAPALAAS